MARGIWRGQAFLVVMLSVASVACSQFGNLQAKKAFKDANGLYSQGDYRGAAAQYEEALKADPELIDAYFYLGNSYDNLYKPARKGEAENDAYLQKAMQNYKASSEKLTDPAKKKLSLQYLASVFGPEKLADPAQAEPIIKQLIQMEPNDSGAYLELAKLYEDAGRFEEAEKTLMDAKAAVPNKADAVMALASYYNRRTDFDKAAAAYEERANLDQNNPEAFWATAAFFEEKVRKDYRLSPKMKQDYLNRGLAAADKALAIKSDFMEAMTYKGLLLRQQALIEKNPGRVKEILSEADALQKRATELSKLKTSGVGTE